MRIAGRRLALLVLLAVTAVAGRAGAQAPPILIRELMVEGGIMDRLIALANSVVGRVRGGLAHVTILSSASLAAVSGTAVADAAPLPAPPCNTTRPPSTPSSPASTCMSVDLPDPDGPMIAVNQPRSNSTETPSRARTSTSP